MESTNDETDSYYEATDHYEDQCLSDFECSYEQQASNAGKDGKWEMSTRIYCGPNLCNPGSTYPCNSQLSQRFQAEKGESKDSVASSAPTLLFITTDQSDSSESCDSDQPSRTWSAVKLRTRLFKRRKNKHTVVSTCKHTRENRCF